MRAAMLIALTAGCHVERIAAARPAPATYFVALDGNDASSGTFAAPFATLERARDAIRERRRTGGLPNGAVVELRGGHYHVEHAFELVREDSGTAQAPIIYRAHAGEPVEIDGSRPVTHAERVVDEATLARLAPEARGHVLRADLRGIANLDTATAGGVELFGDGKAMPLARWPNDGFARIVHVAGNGTFTYDGDRPAAWADEQDVWLHGYWYWDWADERERVASIDASHHTITLAPPLHGYGYRDGQWFYAYNVLRELDRPGEWYVDRRDGTVLFWPSGSVTVSVAPALVTLTDADYIELRGITFEASRSTAITVTRGDHDVIADCTIRGAGGWGVRIEGGAHDGVERCDISDTGEGGISLAGGDRATLTAAGHFARGNHVHAYARWKRTYQAGIDVSGVGQEISHNQIDDAPHEAIALAGNDHVIEHNDIHDVCRESNDAGAIEAGRDWTMRGTVIRNNVVHDILGFEGRGCNGVMLDDMFSGTTITNNVFDHVARAVLIGGGRDNAITNNVFIDCPVAIHIDARGLSWAAPAVGSIMKERLAVVPYQRTPWRERYPALPRILDDSPGAPSGNAIAHNVSVHSGWTDIDDRARPLLDLTQNLLVEHAP